MAQIIDYNCKVVPYSQKSVANIWNDSTIPIIYRYESNDTIRQCKISHNNSAIDLYVAYSKYTDATNVGAILLWTSVNGFTAGGRWMISNNSGSYTSGVISNTWMTSDDGRYRYFMVKITAPIYYYDDSIITFDSADLMFDTIFGDTSTEVPITYIPINSVLSGPESAASGETVNVSVSFPDGYIYQEQGVSVYNKDGAIPFTYDSGTLTFSMP